MGKHINRASSVTLSRLYKQYEGKWDKIMADTEIKALGYQRHQLEQHLSYQRRKLRAKKDSAKRERGL
jgi:hypothetical protein